MADNTSRKRATSGKPSAAKRPKPGKATTAAAAKRKTAAAPQRSAASQTAAGPAAKLIDQRIAQLADWRGAALKRIREIILKAHPQVVEEWKWQTPVWSAGGLICTGESYKNVVKLTFAKGASLPDPAGLFNSSLDGKVRRAIDIREREKINAAALKQLVRAAAALNLKGQQPAQGKEPKLLAGGNPQIGKADGEAPVQAYIAAMPGWKQDVGRRIDALVTGLVPNVRKAVRWNSPFYGIEGRGWFLAFHVFARYVKVTFFRGTSLKPAPPGGTGQDARWIDLHEDEFDEKQLAAWIKQAAALPGWGKS